DEIWITVFQGPICTVFNFKITFEKITINTDYEIKTSLEEPFTNLDLKPLPDNLEYVFLEEPSFIPVIISSKLSTQNKSKLVSVLKKHKESFAWKMIDIPAENMLVEVGKFTFPDDFLILEMEEDNKVPIILGRPFLHTADAVIRVKQKQLNLGVRTQRMIFNINSAMKHSHSNDDTCFSIDVINEILKEDFDALMDEGSKILHSFLKKKSLPNLKNSWQ
nr:reverse transcriptase domain-containing protein [Tanacetum cinerariifolium]